METMSHPQDLYEHAKSVLHNSYSPYSHFPVAACFRAADGTLFSGCNVENASYGLTLCAEASALGQMVSHGHTKIVEALILIPGDALCPPCGACRQRLHEFSDADTKVHLCTTNGQHKMITVANLLPYPFGSQLLETP